MSRSPGLAGSGCLNEKKNTQKQRSVICCCCGWWCYRVFVCFTVVSSHLTPSNFRCMLVCHSVKLFFLKMGWMTISFGWVTARMGDLRLLPLDVVVTQWAKGGQALHFVDVVVGVDVIFYLCLRRDLEVFSFGDGGGGRSTTVSTFLRSNNNIVDVFLLKTYLMCIFCIFNSIY